MNGKEAVGPSKKVVIINYTGRKGGGALDAYEMAKALVTLGECVIPIISSDIENLWMWKKVPFEKLIVVDTYSSKISYVLNTLTFPFTTQRKIRKEIAGYKIKMIFCPMITFWTDRINALFKGAPIIIANHDPTPHSGSSWFDPMKFKDPYKRADLIVVHSRKFVDYVSGHYGKAVYLPLGRHHLYKDIENKVKIVEYDPAKVNFLFFGRIEDYKGLDVLAEAYRKLQDSYSGKMTLTIVGNGNFSKYAKTYESLKDVTVINRWIKDEEVESVFQGCNLVSVCPYKDATQSGVVLVVYDYGIPVIATNTGGLDEQVINGTTGFLVPANDAVALAGCMQKFLDDDRLIGKLQNGINAFLQEISWEKTAQQLLRFIET